MKKIFQIVFLSFSVLVPSIITYAQDIMVIPGDTAISGTLDSEMILYFQIVNISSSAQTVFLIRTENNLPEDWNSSLCFGGFCFAPNIDSVFSFDPVYPNDTVEASVHFSPDKINPGTAQVQVQIGTAQNPDVRTIINLTASTLPTIVHEQINALEEFGLMQNYPNPFNPATSIEYRVGCIEYVTLKVYDILGNEVATLVSDELTPGEYHFTFSIFHFPLSSGVYFYQLKTENFISTKKFVLIK